MTGGVFVCTAGQGHNVAAAEPGEAALDCAAVAKPDASSSGHRVVSFTGLRPDRSLRQRLQGGQGIRGKQKRPGKVEPFQGVGDAGAEYQKSQRVVTMTLRGSP